MRVSFVIIFLVISVLLFIIIIIIIKFVSFKSLRCVCAPVAPLFEQNNKDKKGGEVYFRLSLLKQEIFMDLDINIKIKM